MAQFKISGYNGHMRKSKMEYVDQTVEAPNAAAAVIAVLASRPFTSVGPNGVRINHIHNLDQDQIIDYKNYDELKDVFQFYPAANGEPIMVHAGQPKDELAHLYM